MKTAEEIAKQIVFDTDNGEGTYPIAHGAEMIKSYAKQHAIDFADYIVRYNGQVAVLYGKDEKMRERDTDVTDLYTEWINTPKE